MRKYVTAASWGITVQQSMAAPGGLCKYVAIIDSRGRDAAGERRAGAVFHHQA